MAEDNSMPNFWWCPTHHLYRGGDERPCADAARLVSAQSAPRVFFPGDTVPADTGVMDETGGGGRRFGWDWVADYVYVECWIPTRAEWQAAVDRARTEREVPGG